MAAFLRCLRAQLPTHRYCEFALPVWGRWIGIFHTRWKQARVEQRRCRADSWKQMVSAAFEGVASPAHRMLKALGKAWEQADTGVWFRHRRSLCCRHVPLPLRVQHLFTTAGAASLHGSGGWDNFPQKSGVCAPLEGHWLRAMIPFPHQRGKPWHELGLARPGPKLVS